MLITHLGFTRDPPQKWFPFLHRRGQMSYKTQQHSVFDLFMAGLNTIKHQTHLSLRLTVHGELPGTPLTIRILVLWKRSSLFPHSLNSTFSVSTKRWYSIIVKKKKKKKEKMRNLVVSCCLILIQKLTYWFSHGHFLSSCLEKRRKRWIMKLPLKCDHTVY